MFDDESMGIAFQMKGDYANAERYYQNALKQNDKNIKVLTLLGDLYNECNRLDESLKLLNKAIKLNNQYYVAYHILGKLYLKLNKVKESIDCFETALRINPNNPLCRTNFSQTLLMDGQFIRGWKENESRYEAEVYGPTFAKGWTRWEGQDLSGKTIYVYPESGFGDVIQFVRYVPFLKEFGNPTVVLGAPPAIRKLLRHVKGTDDVTSYGCDSHFQIATMSFPHIFKTTESTIPRNVPYLDIEYRPIEQIQKEVGFKIGIVWGGNPFADNPSFANMNRIRSIQLEDFSPISKLKNVKLFSLQTKDNPASKQMEQVSFPIIDVMGEVTDFLDTAKIIANLDLVICVDTSVAHLAGAMNKPVWMLSRFGGCWRWMQNRSDSPWYPSMKIFRQTKPGDWKPVISQVKRELKQIVL